MKSSNIRRKGVFISWLLSYILILLIPLMIYIFAYSQSTNTIEYEINSAHAASLKQLRQVIDSRLTDIKRLSIQIALNKKILALIRQKKSIDTQHIYKMTDIIEDMKTYQIANSFVDELYIYFKNHGFVLSQNGKCPPEEFYSFYCTGYGQSYEEWLEMLNESYDGRFIIPDNHGQKSSNEIFFLKSLPIEYADFYDGTIVITMNVNTLMQALQDIKWVHQGIVMIVDWNNAAVISTGEFDKTNRIIHDKLNDKLNDDQASFYENIQGQEVVVSYVTSDITGWKYISILPTRVFLDKAKYVQKIIILCTCLCLIIGGWIAYLLSRRNYHPVKRVVEVLVDKAGMASNKVNDELYFIEQSILHVLEEKDKLNGQLDEQKDILKNDYLARLVKGNLKNGMPVQDVLENYNIYFDNDYYGVMLFYRIDVSGSVILVQSDHNSGRALEISRFIIKNVVEELINQRSRGYMTDIDNMLVCIANFEKQDDAAEIMNDTIDKARRFIKEKFGISFLASISNIHINDEGIPLAYQEALEAFEYSMIMGKNQTIHYSEIDVPGGMHQGSSFNERQKLINAVKMDNYKEAEEIFNYILEKDFAQTIPSMQMLRCRIFGLVNTMILIMEEASVDYEAEFWEKLKPVERLLKCNTIDDLKKQMHFILKQMDKYAVEDRKRQEQTLNNDIISFVDTNYTNVNLSVSMIADKYQINPSYLSRFFKKQTGLGLLDYIHTVRINTAKKLIDGTDINLKDISNKVGYYNNVAFIRAFKRYEGITPSQYRDMKLRTLK